jgi:hypothetical protein
MGQHLEFRHSNTAEAPPWLGKARMESGGADVISGLGARRVEPPPAGWPQARVLGDQSLEDRGAVLLPQLRGRPAAPVLRNGVVPEAPFIDVLVVRVEVFRWRLVVEQRPLHSADGRLVNAPAAHPIGRHSSDLP